MSEAIKNSGQAANISSGDVLTSLLSQKSKAAPGWLKSLSDSARDYYQGALLPGRKDEHWKYTNLRVLKPFSDATIAEPLPSSVPEEFLIPGLNALFFVCVNGVWDSSLSSDISALPEGLEVVRFSDANEIQQARIQQCIKSDNYSKNNPFVGGNLCALDDGLFIYTHPNAQIEKNIVLVHLNVGGEQPTITRQNTLVYVDKSASLSFLEQFVSTDDVTQLENTETASAVFTSGLTNMYVADNAQLTHYRLHEEAAKDAHVGLVNVVLNRASTINSFHLAMGSLLQRIDVVVNHNAEGAHCDLNGVYLPRDFHIVDFHTTIEHKMPNCTSEEVFRGIISDSAKAIFNGRIHIHPQAQKTLARLSNKNLLTSQKAEVDTKPELEIYADDVQCAHGATVAQLDEYSIHYFKTRGISEAEARVMLNFGFINELINGLKNESIGDYLRPKLAALFARDPKLLRHIA